MKPDYKNILTICTVGILLITLSLWSWFRTPDKYSESERRVLASAPKLSFEEILSGDYTEDFEVYSQDQFPLRDNFRTLKALSTYYLFNQSDNHDIYRSGEHVSQLIYPLKESMLDHAADRFRWIYDNYLAETDVSLFFSIIPDKNYYLAESSGYLAMDYDELFAYMQARTSYMTYIDISELLSAADYYHTDSHWRQDSISDVADRLLTVMSTENSAYDEISSSLINPDYTWNTLPYPFYGVYSGLSALPLNPDTIIYATSPVLDNCTVISYDTGMPEPAALYDMEAAAGRDPYEMFVSGSCALITIDNPLAATDKKLILFRDSFGSSLTPLLVHNYARVTLVDIRYIQSSMLEHFIEFDDQDVLFMYSTLLLNDSLGLR